LDSSDAKAGHRQHEGGYKVFKSLIGGITGIAVAASLVLGAGAADEARVRVIHASPDAPNVDVYANGNAVLTDVPFKASSGYLAVPAGDYTFEVYPAGANADTTDAVLTIEASLTAGTDYTVVAQGAVADIEAGVFVDNNAAPATGKAHINVIHAGPDAPAVDVAVAGGPVLVSNLAFGEKAGPLPVDAATDGLEVRPAGTQDVALAVDGVKLECGKVYTFVATGFLSGDPALTVLAFAEAPLASGTATTMTPPNTGDGGLVGTSDGGSVSIYLIVSAVLLSMVGFAGLARRAAVRS
jgi:hypothetical protein